MEAVGSLSHLNALLLLKVVGAERSVSTARVNDLGLVDVREESNDILLLV